MDKQQIEQILQQYKIKNYTIRPDGTVDIDGNVYLTDRGLTKLPVRFGKVTGFFCCFNNQLTSLEGAPQTVGGDFHCDNNHLTSLEGIHKIIKSSKYMNFVNNPIKSHVLGLLLIKDLRIVYFSNKQLKEIMNRHLQGDRDIIDCASDLIDAGLDDFAQL